MDGSVASWRRPAARPPAADLLVTVLFASAIVSSRSTVDRVAAIPVVARGDAPLVAVGGGHRDER